MDRRAFFRALGVGVATLAATEQVAAARRRLALGDHFVAGFRFHSGMEPAVARQLVAGARLAVVPEASNPHDARALALHVPTGERIGYVPRRHNLAPSTLAGQGVAVTAEVLAVDEAAPPWERVLVRLYVEV